MAADRPSWLIVVLDSVRRDHVGCYGYGRETTPHIDRIAAQGTLFRRASAASCWTVPSHASLFTGRYPSEHGVDLEQERAGGTAPSRTVAELLAGRGYDTASITCNGFLASKEALTAGFGSVVDVEGLAGGREGFLPRAVRSVHRRWRRATRPDRGAEAATRMAERWLRERRGRPFFLFLNYMDCHAPYRLRPRERLRFVRPERREAALRTPNDPFAAMAGRIRLAEPQLQDLRDQYDGCLRYLDERVGRLDGVLEALGRRDDTVVAVTSDHGESFGEHGLLDHQYGLYEHLIGVPLVVRGPGFDAGREDERLVQHVDVLPTVAESAGADCPEGAGRGIALFPKPGSEAPREALAEYLHPNLRQFLRRFPDLDLAGFARPLRSVRTARWKLIQAPEKVVGLFDLQADPGERRDRSSEYPEVASRLRGRLFERLGEWPVAGERRGGDGMDALRDRLEALGYL